MLSGGAVLQCNNSSYLLFPFLRRQNALHSCTWQNESKRCASLAIVSGSFDRLEKRIEHGDSLGVMFMSSNESDTIAVSPKCAEAHSDSRLSRSTLPFGSCRSWKHNLNIVWSARVARR